jgi:hypothetical protein
MSKLVIEMLPNRVYPTELLSRIMRQIQSLKKLAKSMCSVITKLFTFNFVGKHILSNQNSEKKRGWWL